MSIFARQYVNIPNALSLIRLVGVPLLFPLAGLDNPMFFLAWYIFLGLTDWLDGKLARAWNQTSEFGSALDSVADLAYYISTAYFLVSLFPEYVTPSLPFIYIFFALLGISMIISWIKCRRFVMLHTHLTRFNGMMVFLVMVGSFWFNTTLAISAILLIYFIAYIEIILIFLKFGDVSGDTRSIFILLRDAEKPLQRN
jgi:cardiolipin synthase (CMP-forming)